MPRRVLAAAFGHETNTFSRLRTGLNELRALYCGSLLLDSGLPGIAFGALIDPQAASALHALGAGAEATLDLGGKIDPAFGPPLRLSGVVCPLDMG